MSSKLQGDLSEQIGIMYFTSKGYVCSKPVSHSSNYDFIVDIDSVLLRVEVKSSSYKRNEKSYVVSLITSGGNRSWNGEVKRISSKTSDIVFIYTTNGDIYSFKSCDLEGKRTVSVNKNMPQYLGNVLVNPSPKAL